MEILKLSVNKLFFFLYYIYYLFCSIFFIIILYSYISGAKYYIEKYKFFYFFVVIAIFFILKFNEFIFKIDYKIRMNIVSYFFIVLFFLIVKLDYFDLKYVRYTLSLYGAFFLLISVLILFIYNIKIFLKNKDDINILKFKPIFSYLTIGILFIVSYLLMQVGDKRYICQKIFMTESQFQVFIIILLFYFPISILINLIYLTTFSNNKIITKKNFKIGIYFFIVIILFIILFF